MSALPLPLDLDPSHPRPKDCRDVKIATKDEPLTYIKIRGSAHSWTLQYKDEQLFIYINFGPKNETRVSKVLNLYGMDLSKIQAYARVVNVESRGYMKQRCLLILPGVATICLIDHSAEIEFLVESGIKDHNS